MSSAGIIGAGFYGLYLSLLLSRQFDEVIVYELNGCIFNGASRKNQGRVHRGFHYPRSLKTAVSCARHFVRFENEFNAAVVEIQDHFYGISKRNSKITGSQFERFYRLLNQKEPVKYFLQGMTNIELLIKTQESAFDANKLLLLVMEKIRNAGNIKIVTCNNVETVAEEEGDVLITFASGKHTTHEAVYNVTYDSINQINARSGLPIIPMKQQLCEICIVEIDQPETLCVTIMDGDFFSLMPYPSLNASSLTHVRYTPHHSWIEADLCSVKYTRSIQKLINRNDVLKTNYEYMVRGVNNFFPNLRLKYLDSIWTLKTLPVSMEVSDSRPILVSKNHGIKNYTCILGSKIDAVYDMERIICE